MKPGIAVMKPAQIIKIKTGLIDVCAVFRDMYSVGVVRSSACNQALYFSRLVIVPARISYPFTTPAGLSASSWEARRKQSAFFLFSRFVETNGQKLITIYCYAKQ